MRVMTSEDMHGFAVAVFVHYGATRANAAIAADHLVDASLRGLEAHGIMRVPEYARQLQTGQIDGRAEPVVKERGPGLFHVDGNHGFGQVAMMKAVDLMIHSLETQPQAAAAVVRVGHTGRIGYYSEALATRRCLAVIFGGGGHQKYPSVAPFGGKRGVMSTNPVAFSMPALPGAPISVDFATATTAGGKLRYARDNGQELPEGHVIDRHGRPTRSPAVYFDGGSILPVAGPKGSGLGMIGELLGYALLGEAGEFNWMLQAVRLEAFGEWDVFEERAASFMEKVHATEPAEGFDRVTYPGEREQEAFLRRRSEGIEVSPGVHAALLALSETSGIALPEIRSDERSHPG